MSKSSQISQQQTYRLGSMPRRLFSVRCQPRWPERELFDEMLGLLNEWIELLGKIKSKPLLADVQAFKACIEAEKTSYTAHQDYKLQQHRYRMLRQMGKDTPKLDPPRELPADHPNSYELARDLRDKAETANIRELLPEDFRDLHEMGELIAQCRAGESDEIKSMRIWTIAKGLGIEEWVTGKPAGSPLDHRDSIHRMIMNRLGEVDELFSTQSIPQTKDASTRIQGKNIETDLNNPWLTIEEASQYLRVGEDTIERLISSGQLIASEISSKGKNAGRKIKRIHQDNLDKFMKANQTPNSVADIAPRRREKKPKSMDFFEKE